MENTHIEPTTKREAIIEAARALFAQKGYEETTIADIARAAGVAVGTVYLYFHNKHEIYTVVALDIETLITDAFQDPALLQMPFEQVPRAMVDALFSVGRKHMHLLCLLQVEVRSTDEISRYRSTNQKITQALTVIFEQAIARGQLAPFQTEMYAQILNLTGGNLLHQCFAIEKGEREKLYSQYLVEFIERLFFGPSLQSGKQSEE